MRRLLLPTLLATRVTAPAPPPMHNLLSQPPPPPPALVAGLRSTISGIEGCDAPCFERAEDWFEQAQRWGAHDIVSMVRLGLVESFVGALTLPPDGEAEIRRRLGAVSTTLSPEHTEL